MGLRCFVQGNIAETCLLQHLHALFNALAQVLGTVGVTAQGDQLASQLPVPAHQGQVRQRPADLLPVAGGVHLQGFARVDQRPENLVNGLLVFGKVHRDAMLPLDIPQGVGQVGQGCQTAPRQ